MAWHIQSQNDALLYSTAYYNNPITVILCDAYNCALLFAIPSVSLFHLIQRLTSYTIPYTIPFKQQYNADFEFFDA